MYKINKLRINMPTSFYEYYKCRIADILKNVCKGPYATEEEALNDHSLAWTTDPTTLSVFKYQPQLTKNMVLQFKHMYANTGIFNCKPK
jgi:hypothetical protein